ncbi:MAG: FkbM family methyltransferase [bacterium]|nr:FkbM family methyltransferase [bacterium]
MNKIIFSYHLARIMRPFLKLLPFARGSVYMYITGSKFCSHRVDDVIKSHVPNPIKVFFDSLIKAFVVVDLTDWSCRDHYFTGRYFDRLNPLLIKRILSNGGTYIDVGANRGLHTLFAANVLKKNKGKVFTFEPNPDIYKIINTHLLINNVKNCKTFNMGLSDKKEILSLKIPSNTGNASFISQIDSEKNVIDVNVNTMDSALKDVNLSNPVLIKIDTEGFEYNVLKGMEKILKNPKVNIICEVTDEWLRKTGSSALQLFNFMKKRGYIPYLCETRNTGLLLRKRITMDKINNPVNIRQYDVFFTKNESIIK